MNNILRSSDVRFARRYAVLFYSHLPMKNDDLPATIDDIRDTIDEADECLLRALAMRFKAIEFVRLLKKQDKLPVTDKKREDELKQHWKTQAQKLGLREEFVLLILDFILHESKHLQRSAT